MRLVAVLFACGVFAVCWVAGSGNPAAAQDKKSDEKKPDSKVRSVKNDVAPILNTACTGCHGGAKKKAGIDLSSYDGVMKTVKANEADKSRLVKSVIGQGAKLMPPKKGLPESQVDILKAWIAAGAK